jgi:hypothetical protein
MRYLIFAKVTYDVAIEVEADGSYEAMQKVERMTADQALGQSGFDNGYHIEAENFERVDTEEEID